MLCVLQIHQIVDTFFFFLFTVIFIYYYCFSAMRGLNLCTLLNHICFGGKKKKSSYHQCLKSCHQLCHSDYESLHIFMILSHAASHLGFPQRVILKKQKINKKER